MPQVDYNLRSFWFAPDESTSEADFGGIRFVEAAPLIPLGKLACALAALERLFRRHASDNDLSKNLHFGFVFCIKQVTHWQVCLDSRSTALSISMWAEWTDMWCASMSVIFSIQPFVDLSRRTTGNGWQVFHLSDRYKQEVVSLFIKHPFLDFSQVKPYDSHSDFYRTEILTLQSPMKVPDCAWDNMLVERNTLVPGSPENHTSQNPPHFLSKKSSPRLLRTDVVATDTNLQSIIITLTQREATFLIGRAGCRLTQIRSQCDCAIKVHGSRSPANIPRRSAVQQVSLIGTLTNTKMALGVIARALATYTA